MHRYVMISKQVSEKREEESSQWLKKSFSIILSNFIILHVLL